MSRAAKPGPCCKEVDHCEHEERPLRDPLHCNKFGWCDAMREAIKDGKVERPTFETDVLFELSGRKLKKCPYCKSSL